MGLAVCGLDAQATFSIMTIASFVSGGALGSNQTAGIQTAMKTINNIYNMYH
jgi:hypothetical protein